MEKQTNDENKKIEGLEMTVGDLFPAYSFDWKEWIPVAGLPLAVAKNFKRDYSGVISSPKVSSMTTLLYTAYQVASSVATVYGAIELIS